MPETEITSTVDNDSLRESIHAEEGGREEGRRRRAAPSETGAAHSLVVFVCCPYSSKHLRSGSCVCPTRRRFLGRWRCSPLRLGVPPTHIRRRRGGHVSSSLDTAESPFAGSEGETIISRKGEASAPAPRAPWPRISVPTTEVLATRVWAAAAASLLPSLPLSLRVDNEPAAIQLMTAERDTHQFLCLSWTVLTPPLCSRPPLFFQRTNNYRGGRTKPFW